MKISNPQHLVQTIGSECEKVYIWQCVATETKVRYDKLEKQRFVLSSNQKVLPSKKKKA